MPVTDLKLSLLSIHMCSACVIGPALAKQIKDDLVDAASAKAAAEAAQRGNMLMNALWSIVGGGKQVGHC
jgi:hypothetical protein